MLLFSINLINCMNQEKKLFTTLINNKLTVSIAESCTGGKLSNRITNIPGSSTIFLLGIISYSNDSKSKILKIPKKIIKTKGAVSKETAKLMSQNIRKLADSNIGIAITGIAGPNGGSKNKPVGTVFIAVSSKKKTHFQKFNFTGGRLAIKKKSADKAIQMILEFIKNY